MNSNHQLLEKYLRKLDRCLENISVSEKAEIITEIRCHVLETQEREPEKSIQEILSALGEPETVANKYLMEKGQSPHKAPKHPIVKWIVIGLLGTTALILVAIFAFIAHFTPLIKVDDDKGRIEILGGLIDISDSDISADGEKISIKGLLEDADINASIESESYNGESSMENEETLELNFKNGVVKLDNSPDQYFRWECEVAKIDGQITDKAAAPKNILDLRNLKFKICNFKVPAGKVLNLKGNNGTLEVNLPHFSINGELKNGLIALNPDPNKKYDYLLSVEKGFINNTFKNQPGPDAININLKLESGAISQGN